MSHRQTDRAAREEQQRGCYRTLPSQVGLKLLGRAPSFQLFILCSENATSTPVFSIADTMTLKVRHSSIADPWGGSLGPLFFSSHSLFFEVRLSVGEKKEGHALVVELDDLKVALQLYPPWELNG